MRINSFFSLVEIRTKIASVIPFLLGTIYTLYHFKTFILVNFLLMFASMIIFDMLTTTLNNYFDFKRAKKKHGYGYEDHNAIVRDELKESMVISAIIIMLILSIAFGVLLVLYTNLIVLFIGILSFIIGITYSFGPVSISSTPLGELMSGFFMGVIIVFLSVYIHVYDQGILALRITGWELFISADLKEILYIMVLSIPTFCGIANIMLANNICDVEDDLENRRFTLPMYIGNKKSLWLFAALYIFTYMSLVLMVVLKVFPWICLVTLPTSILVFINVKKFFKLQSKKETFAYSVQNFVLSSVPLIIIICFVWAIQ